MKYKVLVSAPYFIPEVERFREQLESKGIELIIPEVEERMEEADLLPYMEYIDGTICGDDRYSERVLSQAKKLKVISKWGTGIDSINKEYCEKVGIMVGNTPDAFTVPVSDTIMAYILAFARNVPFMTQAMREGIWKKIQGRALNECTIGVVGVGNIGKAVLRKANAFGMNLLCNDIKPISNEVVDVLKAKAVSLEELLANSDFVCMCCDLNPTSHHLMNDRTFALTKKGAVLINTARGPIVDEKALVNYLQSGHLAGAGLDVFEEEPLPVESPLLKMENVLVAPHNSNSSKHAWERIHTSTVANLFKGLGIE